MKKLTKGKGMLGMLLVSFMLCALAVPALAETGMSISPDTQTVNAGESFDVDVVVAPGIPSLAAQCDLSFDASLVQVDSVTEGTLYSGGGTTYFNAGGIDNTAGKVTGAAVSILGGIPVTEAGTFITLHMTAKSGVDGISPLALSGVIVADASAAPIPGVVINDGDVVVMLPSQCTLTTSASPSEGGTVNGGGAYDCGATVAVEAVPTGESWYFTGWSGDLSGSENPTTILMDGDKSVTANFDGLVKSPKIGISSILLLLFQ